MRQSANTKGAPRCYLGSCPRTLVANAVRLPRIVAGPRVRHPPSSWHETDAKCWDRQAEAGIPHRLPAPVEQTVRPLQSALASAGLDSAGPANLQNRVL